MSAAMSTEDQRRRRAVRRLETKAMIEAGKIKVLEELKANGHKIIATLSDAEWKNLKRNEDRRRRGE